MLKNKYSKLKGLSIKRYCFHSRRVKKKKKKKVKILFSPINHQE